MKITILGHSTVYTEDGIYAGWPANHGAWQWGDEFLVGFMRGPHEIGGMHNIARPFQKVQARSLDGGNSWSVEIPSVDFEAAETSPAPEFDLAQSIIRVCGRYDHGGEQCTQEGGFYISGDRGRSWAGAYAFDGLDRAFNRNLHCTSRTSVLDGVLFLTSAHKNVWGSDFTFCATHDGRAFEPHGVVLNGTGRAVMPKAANVGDRMVVVMRRFGSERAGGWIDACFSDDRGATWSKPVLVAETGMHNGNPPALIELDGVLYCAFANRSNCQLLLSRSADGGETWSQAAVLRENGDSDIGYPQFFKRSDGLLLCVYYWADFFEDCQRIEVTRIKP